MSLYDKFHIESYMHLNSLQVCSKALVGILLCVFVRKEHFAHVKVCVYPLNFSSVTLHIMQDVMIDTAGVGILNVAGNKGGVAVRFGLYDSTVCIVNR